MAIAKEDYKEPRCLLDMTPPSEKPVRSIDVRRVEEKLYELLDREEFDRAEKLLDYWMAEAQSGNDRRGEFAVLNEIAGLKRKLGKKDEAVAAAERAVALGNALGIMDNVGGATAYINQGTVYEAFDRAKDAVASYEKALPVYEKELEPLHPKRGGLYNNLAMALALSGRYDEAFSYYDMALGVMSNVPGGEIECALTKLNMANCYEAKYGLLEGSEMIEECLADAQELLDTPGLANSGYYAFMADKCVETFRYYGWFAYADELEKRVKDTYERIRSGI